MQKNVGGIDRGIRFAIAAVLVIAGAIAPVSPTVRVVMFVFAGLAFMTGVARFCPLWPLLGINTYKKKEGQD